MSLISGDRHYAVSGVRSRGSRKQVTTPLEISLSGLLNAVRMFSHTQIGLSFLIVTFDDRADDYQARQLVLERLRGSIFPTKPKCSRAVVTDRRAVPPTERISRDHGASAIRTGQ
jgi:multidrug efflux pump subunit AcrB